MNKYCHLRLQNRITQLSSLFHIIMKISYNWLKQLINIDLPLEEVCEKLTMSGLEVEHIIETESIKGGLKNLIVGEVMSKTKHPNIETL